MEPEGSTPHSQEPVTFILCQTNPIRIQFYVLRIHFNIILPLRRGFPVVSFLQVTLPKPRMHLSSTSCGLRDEFVYVRLNPGLEGTRGHETANTNWIALCDYFNVKDQNHSNVRFTVFRGPCPYENKSSSHPHMLSLSCPF